MQKASVGDVPADVHDFPIVIATMPATARQRKAAFGAFIVLVAFVAVTIPFANVQLAHVEAFVPVIQTVMCVADLLTAALLFAQYSVYPNRAVLVLASGYLFGGLFAFLQTLAFPEAYAPAGLIGDGINSAGWLFVLWHTAFPLSVIVYALSKHAGESAERRGASAGVTIGFVIACVLALTAGSTWLVTAGAGYLPSLYESVTRQAPFANDITLFLALLNATTLVLLFIRRRTILDHWLIVTLLAWLPNFVVSILFTVVRFTIGWYASRVYALFAGSSLLFVLLAETAMLHARLANAIVLLRRERADRLAIFNTVVDGIITIDRNGTVQTLNRAAARLFGYSPDEVIGRNVKMLMPEPYRRQHDMYIENYLETGQAKVIGIGRELSGLRKDGSTFPMELAISETASGGLPVFTGVVRDITERKQFEEHQRRLVAELDHRVKNVLARVIAVADSTRRGSSSIDEFSRAHKERIQSMAVAHGLLSQSGWQGVGLNALVRDQLAPYTSEANTTIDGPDVVLTAMATQSVAMVLHELVTNAAKYGALSTPDGRVSVAWHRHPNMDASAKLLIEWQETGGPAVVADVRSGYGTNLIRDLIPHELGGKVELLFMPGGACCKIEIPL
jgi:PAS domain S-box-containing protein